MSNEMNKLIALLWQLNWHFKTTGENNSHLEVTIGSETYLVHNDEHAKHVRNKIYEFILQ